MKHLVAYLLILLLSTPSLWSQTKVKVVTKKVSHSFNYDAGDLLKIVGQKAEINVSTWDGNSVEVEAALISKHPTLETAKADLEKLFFTADKKRSDILLRNYVLVEGEKEKPKSNLKVILNVKIPSFCELEIDNRFGTATVDGLEKSLLIKGEFSKIYLSDISAKTNVNTRFGDLDVINMSGLLEVNSNRSNITLKEMSGRHTINAKYGEIKIYGDEGKGNIKIEAEKADVYYFNPSLLNVIYDLRSNYGNIDFSKDLNFVMEADSKKSKHATFNDGEEDVEVLIKVAFGDINMIK